MGTITPLSPPFSDFACCRLRNSLVEKNKGWGHRNAQGGDTETHRGGHRNTQSGVTQKHKGEDKETPGGNTETH